MSFKKSMLLFALGSMMVSLLPACSDGGNEIQYASVLQDKDGEWGFVNSNGEFFLADEFETCPSAVVNGFFSVSEDEGYTLYKFDEKKPEVLKDCENLKDLGFFSDGLCPIVRPKSKIEIINEDGEVKFTLEPVKGKQIASCSSSFEDGLIAVANEDNEWGYVDKKGNVVVDPTYYSAADFSEGFAVVSKKKDNDDEKTFMVIDKNGEKIFQLKKDQEPVRRSFKDGILIVEDGDRFAFYDTKGEATKLSSKIKGVKDWSGRMIAFRGSDGQGVIDLDGEVIVRAKYDKVFLMPDEKILASKPDEAKVFDKNGDELFAIEGYSYVEYVDGIGMIGHDGEDCQMIDNEGNDVKKAEFRRINTEKSPWIIVKSDYFDLDGMINKIMADVSEKGFRMFRLGSSPNTILNTDPSNYTYRSSVDIDAPEIKGYHWYTTAKAQFNQNMAIWDWGRSAWNPNAKLTMIEVKIHISSTLTLSDEKKVVDAFKAKGFKVIAEPSASSKAKTGIFMLKKGNCLMHIWLKDHDLLDILLWDNRDDMESSLLKQTVDLNNELAENAND